MGDPLIGKFGRVIIIWYLIVIRRVLIFLKYLIYPLRSQPRYFLDSINNVGIFIAQRPEHHVKFAIILLFH